MDDPREKFFGSSRSPEAAGVYVDAGADTFRLGKSPDWRVKRKVGSKSRNPDAAVAYILEDRQYEIGKGELFRRRVFKLQTQSAVQECSRIEIGFDPENETLVVHQVTVWRDKVAINVLKRDQFRLLQRESGLEQHQYDGRLTAVLIVQDVRAGDIIDYSFTIKDKAEAVREKFSVTQTLEWPFSVQDYYFSLHTPAGRKLRLRYHKEKIAPEVEELEDGGRILTWYRKDSPEVALEHNMPAWYLPVAWVQVTEFADWGAVAKWVCGKWAPHDTESEELDQQVAWIRENFAEGEAQIREAIRFVQDDIRYLTVTSGMGAFVPSSPAHTIKRRLGDCKDKSLLLSRLLNKLGVVAQPALVNSMNGKMPSQSLPSLNVFNHVIVRMEREGGEALWIDATVSYERGALAERVNPKFEHALIVAEESTDLVEIPFDALQWGEVVTDDHFYLDELPVKLQSSAVYTGCEANRLRYLCLSGGKQHFTRMLEDHLKHTYPTIKGDGDIEIEDDEEMNQLTVRRNYTLPDFSQDAQQHGNEVYSLQVDAIISRVIGSGETTREHPFAILFPCKVTQQFKIFTGADLRNIRKDNIRFVTRDFEFTAALKSARNGVEISYFYQSRRNHVPVSGYPIYRKELLKTADFLVYSLELPKKRKLVRATSEMSAGATPVKQKPKSVSARRERAQVTADALDLPPMTPHLEKEIKTLEPEKSGTYKRRRRTSEQGKNHSLKNPAKGLLKAMGVLLLVVVVGGVGVALMRSKDNNETKVKPVEKPIEMKSLIEPEEEYTEIEKVGIPTPKTELKEVEDGLEALRQLIAEGESENAIVEAERILGRNPKSAEVWEMLAELYLSQADIEGALSASAEAEELAPENATVLTTRGSVLYAKERFEASLVSFDRATKMKSDFYRAWEGVGMSCLKLYRYEDAKVALRKAVEIDPKNPKAKNNLAVALMQTGDVESAEDQLRMCLEIAPKYLNAWENLLEIYKRKNSPDKVAEIRNQIAVIRSTNENTTGQ